MGTSPLIPVLPMTKRLPESVQQIADVIGADAAMDLVRRCPRTKARGDTPSRPVLYVPARLTPEHPLVGILGWIKAEALTRMFGGELIFPATCANVIRDSRDDEIASAVKNNATPAAIAIRFGITERRVRQIIAKMRAEKPAMGTRAAHGDYAANVPQAAAA